jgi:hypothetical protein
MLGADLNKGIDQEEHCLSAAAGERFWHSSTAVQQQRAVRKPQTLNLHIDLFVQG